MHSRPVQSCPDVTLPRGVWQFSLTLAQSSDSPVQPKHRHRHSRYRGPRLMLRSAREDPGPCLQRGYGVETGITIAVVVGEDPVGWFVSCPSNRNDVRQGRDVATGPIGGPYGLVVDG